MDVQPLPFPWERRDTEKDQPWRAFQMYRDLGPDRSISQVAQRLVDDGVYKGSLINVKRNLGTWSAAHDWVERATAWDKEADRRRVESNLDAQVRMGEQHATQAAAYLRTLLLPAQVIIARLQRSQVDDLEKLSTKELLRLAVASARVFPSVMQAERLARGQATSLVGFATPTRGQEGAEMTLEERLSKVFAALEEAGVGPDGAADGE